MVRRYDRGGGEVVVRGVGRPSPVVPVGDSVVSVTDFDDSPRVGTSPAYSRADHSHGSPSVVRVETIISQTLGGHASNAFLGVGVPLDTIGMNGDFYIDTVTLDLYVKEGGTWL